MTPIILMNLLNNNLGISRLSFINGLMSLLSYTAMWLSVEYHIFYKYREIFSAQYQIYNFMV